MFKKGKTLLQIKKVVKEFKINSKNIFSKKNIVALDGVSLKIKYGESFGIVGESGSGKSTLARTILGLETPQSGEIIFMGKELHSLKPKELKGIRKKLQMIFQDPYGSLDPKQNVYNIISEPLSLLDDIYEDQKKNKIVDVLEKVGLSHKDISKYPHEFSGGQRQRIAIARALITKPSLIVADEPVSALDVSVQAQVLNLMMDLKDEHGLAYLFISHDLSIVRQITTKLAVMYNGKIVETGSTENLFNNPLHPYTRDLIESIPKLNPKRKIKNSKKLFYRNTENSNFKIIPKGCNYEPHCSNAIDKCKNNLPLLKGLTNNSFRKYSLKQKRIKHEVACYNPLN